MAIIRNPDKSICEKTSIFKIAWSDKPLELQMRLAVPHRMRTEGGE